MADWFTYEWEVQGHYAFFTVDMDYENIPQGYPYLVHISIQLPSCEPFTGPVRKRAAKLVKKLCKALQMSYYAGSIEMDNLLQYYFYIPTSDDYLPLLEDMALKERKLVMNPTITHEPSWLSYCELLLPDAAKYQTELNREYISRLKKAGDATDKIRRLSIIMCFSSEEDVAFFKESARQAGFAIGEISFQAEYSLPHQLTLHVLSTLEKHSIDSITTRLIRIAQSYGGQLLRWSCPRIYKKSPLE